MKEQAIAIAKRETNSRVAKNKIREYLQHVILRQMFELRIFETIVFHGGTALRILHEFGRFSEDLDFHLAKPETNFDFQPNLKKIKHRLHLAGYDISFKKKLEKTVQTVFVKFNGLAYESGISPNQNEILMVKLKIDTNPPDGFETDATLINKYFQLMVKHHDLSSFLAGKLIAIFQRSYIKGRDFYDLQFLLSRWQDLTPNFQYLNNGLRQGNYSDTEITEKNWKQKTIERTLSVDWKIVVQDIEPFIENQSDMPLISQDLFLNLLR